MTTLAWLLALPPGCDVPPACGLARPKRAASDLVVYFSMRVRTGDTWKTCTLVLRGGAEQFIAEVERSLHDAIMIVKRAIKNKTIVAGGGACEMEISAYLHSFADKNVSNKQQSIIKAFAKLRSLEKRGTL